MGCQLSIETRIIGPVKLKPTWWVLFEVALKNGI